MGSHVGPAQGSGCGDPAARPERAAGRRRRTGRGHRRPGKRPRAAAVAAGEGLKLIEVAGPGGPRGAATRPSGRSAGRRTTANCALAGWKRPGANAAELRAREERERRAGRHRWPSSWRRPRRRSRARRPSWRRPGPRCGRCRAASGEAARERHHRWSRRRPRPGSWRYGCASGAGPGRVSASASAAQLRAAVTGVEQWERRTGFLETYLPLLTRAADGGGDAWPSTAGW